ncbi:MAG: SGNH/GDSL hydrolase family protein [Planctomycetota bacterium]|jgi:hypothetical protein
MNPLGINRSLDRYSRLRSFNLAPFLLLVLLPVGGIVLSRPGELLAVEPPLGVCGDKYVACGDHVPAGEEVSESERYPNQLLTEHLETYGFCLFNLAQEDTTSMSYMTDGQMAEAWNLRPDFITLTVGRENSTIVNLITDCFDKVKDHDFAGATACALAVLANENAYDTLYKNLVTILQQYRMTMAGRPHLIVAVVGYPNPYPRAEDVLDEIALLSIGTVDAIISTTIRWIQLPPALLALDEAIKKLNATIERAVEPFAIGSQNRFVFVNPYEKFEPHVMKMEVTLKLEQVCHLCGTKAQYRDQHESKQNFGSSDPYFVEGPDGTKHPDYLFPDQFIAPPVVFERKSQTTKGMGVHVNAKGHKCLADLIWEWDTPEPGVTPLKWKLGVAEPANSNICQ